MIADRPSARMDAGLDVQTEQPDATSLMDTFVPPDARASGCCLAFNGTNQPTCDQFNAVGRLLCNSFNDGTVCVWSGAATCDDAGVVVDVPNPTCCEAVNAANQPLCDTLETLGRGRCVSANGGGTCVWSAAPFCARNPNDAGFDSGVVTDTGIRMDTGVAACCVAAIAADQPRCSAAEPLGSVRCNSVFGAGCRWSNAAHCTVPDSGVFDSGFFDVPTPGCCLSTNIQNRAICAAAGSNAACIRQAGSCLWRTGATCNAEAGIPGSCCVAAPLGRELTCNTGASPLNCAQIARCTWRCL